MAQLVLNIIDSYHDIMDNKSGEYLFECYDIILYIVLYISFNGVPISMNLSIAILRIHFLSQKYYNLSYVYMYTRAEQVNRKPATIAVAGSAYNRGNRWEEKIARRKVWM